MLSLWPIQGSVSLSYCVEVTARMWLCDLLFSSRSCFQTQNVKIDSGTDGCTAAVLQISRWQISALEFHVRLALRSSCKSKVEIHPLSNYSIWLSDAILILRQTRLGNVQPSGHFQQKVYMDPRFSLENSNVYMLLCTLINPFWVLHTKCPAVKHAFKVKLVEL